MKLKTSLAIGILGLTIASITNRGVVVNESFISFGKDGYYTEVKLTNVGDNVIVTGDMMVTANGITYLK